MSGRIRCCGRVSVSPDLLVFGADPFSPLQRLLCVADSWGGDIQSSSDYSFQCRASVKRVLLRGSLRERESVFGYLSISSSSASRSVDASAHKECPGVALKNHMRASSVLSLLSLPRLGWRLHRAALRSAFRRLWEIAQRRKASLGHQAS